MRTTQDLLLAIEKGDYDTVKDLLTRHRLTDFVKSQRDRDAYQILCKAVSRKDVSIISLLLTKFTKVNYALEFGSPLLFQAIALGHELTVKLLLDKGAELNVKSSLIQSEGRLTGLHLAARRGYLEIVKLLLTREADMNAKDSSQETPLHVSGSYPKVVEYLLSKGARNDASNRLGRTPLYNAIACKCLESIALLIRSGANVNFKDLINKTPLHKASVLSIEIVAYLLHQNARVNDQDNDGNTPLHEAVSGGSIDVVKLLIKHGANIEAANTLNRRPLHLAATRSYVFVDELLNAGASVNVIDNQGKTPLGLAIHQRSLSAVKLLINGGANIDAEKDLLDFAAKNAPSIVQFFLEKGIGVSALKESDQKTLYHAAIKGNLQAVEALFKSGAQLQRETLQNDIAQIGRQSTPGVFKFILDQYPDVRFDMVNGLNESFQIGQVEYLENAVHFIQRGTSVRARFNYEKRWNNSHTATALVHAIMGEKFALAERILAAGAGINQESMLDDVIMTPLYHALSNPIARSVAWCLQQGADVNILPRNWNPKEFKKTKYHPSVKKLIKHIAIMARQQLKVDKRLTASIELHENFVKFRETCDKEIVGMAAEKLNGTVTLSDVLVATNDRLASYARNDNFTKGLKKKKEYEKMYPIYGKDVTTQLKNGIERRKVLNEACQFSRVLFPGLPQIIVDMIFSFLGENDLKIVIDICKRVKA